MQKRVVFIILALVLAAGALVLAACASHPANPCTGPYEPVNSTASEANHG